MRPLPIGVQTFENLIAGGFVYVDKTRHIHEMLKPRQGLYFVSRPRRFGKSLLLTTLKAIFEGKRELFDGLAIADASYAWEEHPVVHLDLSRRPIQTVAEVATCLGIQLDQIAAEHSIQLEREDYRDRFGELIRKLAEINRVVILIDEYDKPILDNISRPEERQRIKEALSGFYGIIKAHDAHLRFVLLTGVSKFSKVSIFSKLNNLEDLTMQSQYADMLGYTQEELETDLQERLDAMGEATGLARKELLDQIRHWYNGYRFSKRDVRVYNPVSTMLMLKTQDFGNYWFETGTPTFLLDVMAEKDYDVRELEPLEVQELAFSTFEVESLRVEPLLFQTGYLTILDYDPETMLYTLGYPNFEVKNAFLQYLVDRCSSVRKELAASLVHKMIRALRANDLAAFFGILRSFFADIDYDLHLKHEKYYQSIFYLVYKLIGLSIHAEVKTNRGRADAVVETDDGIFVFEFKLFDTKEAALAQIKEMGYHEKYLAQGKPVHLIGVEFNVEERNVGEWVTETVE